MSTDIIPFDRIARLPEQYQRRAHEIAKRVSEIDALFPPCAVDDIRDAVLRLRGQFRPQPDTDPNELAAEFKAACRDLPAWAISEAANDFLGGRVENHTGQFMPTCAEFAKRARQILTPFLAERAALRTEASKLVERAADDRRRHLIDMERQNPAVRERVQHLFEQAVAGIPKSRNPILPSGGGEAKARLDVYRRPRAEASKLAETRIVKGK